MNALKSTRRIYTKGVWQMTPDGFQFLPEESKFFDYSGPVAEAAAGTWKIYAKAKYYIGNGTITLGAGVFKMCLLRPSASAAIKVLSTRSTWASIPGEISARGGYAANGRNLLPATAKWIVGASARSYAFTYSTIGLVFTANGSALNNIKYALIRNSTGGGAGHCVCFCTLSTGQFTVASPNTLTIAPAALGVFTMA